VGVREWGGSGESLESPFFFPPEKLKKGKPTKRAPIFETYVVIGQKRNCLFGILVKRKHCFLFLKKNLTCELKDLACLL
jgi:hypothetical protein